ncbi:MAG: HAMP domain-containing histidine kinase [Butyrivibrio sp.]|nr:HAMP domain-containing histidine kinase [Butyrivibrio sp.]
MNKKKKHVHSIRIQFSGIFLVVMFITVFGIVIANKIFLQQFYISNKKADIIKSYESINEEAMNGDITSDEFWIDLQRICDKYSIEVVVLDDESQALVSSSSDSDFMRRILWENMFGVDSADSVTENRIVLEDTSKYTLQQEIDNRTKTSYLEIWGFLDNGNLIMIRSALESIKDNAALTNRFIACVGIISAIIGSILVLFVTNTITAPIHKLSEISSEMKKLNFEVKYKTRRRNANEIDVLGQNINEMSETLETTIKELKSANIELTKDIEKKEEVDNMRKEFISNVSHELKTPIALIQGYAEGLKEAVNDDEESRDFYCEVIMDEANKMNIMVKRLLKLIQIESGRETINMERFDIVSMIKNYLKSADILAKQKNVEVKFEDYAPIYVWGDEFAVEEIIQNYYSNAINHVSGDNVIEFKLIEKDNKIRISVFNTGNPIPEESIEHLWEKFYKVDKARTRQYGGSGVGLSIVKALMDIMGQGYGVINYENGVEFWFELETK